LSDHILNIYTGDEIVINRIRQELENEGIYCIVKDGFKEGTIAGFGGGVPSAIDLFVRENDLERALEIVQAITQE
jgi:hypothetical protein